MTDIPAIIPRKSSEILDDLLRIARRVLDKPHVAFGERPAIDAIKAEIVEAMKRRAESQRFIDETALWLAQSLRNVADAPGPVLGGERSRWTNIAEFFVGYVRGRLQAAAQAELSATPTSDGAEDYVRRPRT